MFVETTTAAVNASAFVYYAATSPKCASLFSVIGTIIECPLKPKCSTCSPPPVLQLVLTQHLLAFTTFRLGSPVTCVYVHTW